MQILTVLDRLIGQTQAGLVEWRAQTNLSSSTVSLPGLQVDLDVLTSAPGIGGTTLPARVLFLGFYDANTEEGTQLFAVKSDEHPQLRDRLESLLEVVRLSLLCSPEQAARVDQAMEALLQTRLTSTERT